MSDKKYILVVGASSGIGAYVAKYLSNRENVIILMARRHELLLSLSKELNGESIIWDCDITDYSQIESFFEYLRDKEIKLSAMIYASGICCVKPLKVMETAELERMFAVNVFGFYEMCRQFQNTKISVRGASIVAFSSYASVTKESGMSAYAMTKSAINTAVEVFAKEFSRREIRVNAILPAYTMSKMGVLVDSRTEDELNEIKKIQPLGVIPLDEIAKLIKFLISSDSNHITGSLIPISAGYRVT